MEDQIQEIKAILTGYIRINSDSEAVLFTVQEWQEAARLEQQRRAARILQSFDDSMLELVASGHINLQSLCQSIQDSLKPGTMPT